MKKLEEFWFRYFSKETESDERYNWLRYVVVIAMMIPAAIGIILDVLHKNGKVPILIFAGMMLIFSIVWIVVWIYHNWRIKHEK